jgi:peptidoglycan/LPS O-acetylase OafA/YrhL
MTILAAVLLCALVACGVLGVRYIGRHLPAQQEAEAAQRYKSFQSAKYFSGLDALRAFSVVAVIWTHTTLPHTIALLNQGNRGVDLFFAISGFLVTTLLLREYRRSGAISLRDFYMRRTLRIFPLYYAVLGLYCVLVFLVFRGTPKGQEFWSNFPAFLTYTSNWFVNLESAGRNGVTFYFAWSLATEEQFYLLWPFVMVLALKFVPRTTVLVVPVTALLLVQLFGNAIPDTFAGRVMGSLAPAILFGVMLAVMMDDETGFRGLHALLGRRWIAPVAAVAMLACLAFGAPWRVSSFAMAVLVASVCLREDTYLHAILKWRPLVYVGTVSYGIYLMHMLGANAARKVIGHDFGTDVFLVTVPIAIAMASVSYHFFERPILRFKSRFSHVPSKTSAPTGAPTPGSPGVLGVTSPLPK